MNAPQPRESPTLRCREEATLTGMFSSSVAIAKRSDTRPRGFGPSRAGSLRHRHRQHQQELDRKSTRLNSSHVKISYAVFCLKKKKDSYTNWDAFDTNTRRGLWYL